MMARLNHDNLGKDILMNAIDDYIKGGGSLDRIAEEKPELLPGLADYQATHQEPRGDGPRSFGKIRISQSGL